MTDENYSPKRQATETQRAYLAARRKQTKLWRSLWKTRPDYMEACRVKATLAASLKVQMANLWLQHTVREWPMIITPAQLIELCLTVPYVRLGRKRRMPHASLVRRLRSMTLISYDPSRAVWVNLLT